MEYGRFGNTVVLRLDKGDEITECVLAVAEKENITCGHLTGIGASNDMTLGVFDTSKGAYIENSYQKDCEITSICGNLSTMNGKHYSHIHINASSIDGVAFGGHLLRSVISLTAEIFITVEDVNLIRERDEKVGINTIRPEKSK